jgi:hypothetical protein
MLKKILVLSVALISCGASAAAIEIDIKNEIDLKDGSYLARELGGQGRYALINHSHGRFEGGDIASAICTNGFTAATLPAKFANVKKVLKPGDFVLTKCSEGQ